MILGFELRLSLNFNHLIYADDLLLVTKCNRKVAWNYNLCISIYSRLTNQQPNFTKLVVYFLSWLNKKVCKKISSILNFKINNFLLLGNHDFFPKTLSLNLLQVMVSWSSKNLAAWSHTYMPKAARVVLINSSIFFLLFTIFLLILDSIAKLARDFLWVNSGNRSVHLMS